MIKMFNVFTGISIENAGLYDKSMMLNERIEAYNEMTRAVAAGRATRDVLRCIRRAIGAGQAQLFEVNKNGVGVAPTEIDEDMDVIKIGEGRKVEEDDVLGVKREIIKRLLMGAEEESEELKNEKKKGALLDKVVKIRASVVESDDEEARGSMMVAPVFAPQSDEMIACVVMQSKKNSQKFTYADTKIFDGYSVFLAISIELSRRRRCGEDACAQ